MALGAQPGDVVGSLIRQGLHLCFVGILLGLAGALALGRFLQNLLFGVAASDAVTVAAVTGTLLMVMPLSNYFPTPAPPESIR